MTTSNYDIIYLFRDYTYYKGGYLIEVKKLGLPTDTPKHKKFRWYRIYKDDSYEGIGSIKVLKFVSSSRANDGKEVRVLKEDDVIVTVLFDDEEVTIDNKKGGVSNNDSLLQKKLLKAIADKNMLF